jgi:glutathione synthase/RimK-type ligase-like ATP-grasp enzyme
MLMKITSSILICCLIFQTFSNLSILTWYQVQKDYIEEVFCVNKDKPIMECHGKCYLSQKLKKNEDQKKDSPVTLEIQSIIFMVQDLHFGLPSIESISSKQYDSYLLGKIRNYITSIFHPPR